MEHTWSRVVTAGDNPPWTQKIWLSIQAAKLQEKRKKSDVFLSTNLLYKSDSNCKLQRVSLTSPVAS